MKKVRNLVIFLLAIFLLFIIVSFTPKNYKYTYKVGKYEITEEFNKKDKVYNFILNNKNHKFEYSLSHKYIKTRGLINKVSPKEKCIKVFSQEIKDFSICKDDNDEYVTSYYLDNVNDKVIDTYGLIDIYNLPDKKFYIWNYTEFLAISEDNKKEIKLFNNDIYELEIITKLKNYLVLADYDQKYKFDQLYMINSKNNKVEKVSLDKELYFNSYILGTYKNNIYVYDMQKEQEYKLNPFKGEISKYSNKILVDKKWETVSENKLNKKSVQFEESNIFGYYLDDNTLYYKTPSIKIKVTNMDVTSIIEANENESYFISEDTLYYTNLDDGIMKVMSYSEWKFASNNIFIF